jgi:hypothetical protein
MKKLLIIGSILVLLIGCASTDFTYYKPVGPGSYFKTQCGGPDELLGFEVSDGLGVMVDTRALRTDHTKAIAASFHLGENHKLEFESPEFMVVSGVPRKSTSYTFTEVVNLDYVKKSDGRWSMKRKNIPISRPLHGALLPEGFRSMLYKPFQNYRTYAVEVPIEGHEEQDITIVFPRILLDGIDVEIPDIKIEYTNRKHMSFIC